MDNGLNVTAIDISDEMVRICKEKNIRAFELDFFNLRHLKTQFDAIWAMNCLLHVEKRFFSKVLKEIDKVLKPLGLFFMGVYGGYDTEGIWEDDIYIPQRYFSFYTDERLKEIVSQYFELISFETIQTGDKYYFQSIIMRKLQN